MHSVVVYGDVRTHVYEGSKSVVYGGAVMMKDIIETRLSQLDSLDDGAGYGVTVFGYPYRSPNDKLELLGFEKVFWEVLPKNALRDSLFEDERHALRSRLKQRKREKNLAKPWLQFLPLMSDALSAGLGEYVHPLADPATAIPNPPTVPAGTADPAASAVPNPPATKLPPGMFCKFRPDGGWADKFEQSQHVWCPDISLFDDLNGYLSHADSAFPLAPAAPTRPAFAGEPDCWPDGGAFPLLTETDEAAAPSKELRKKWIEPVRVLFERVRTSLHQKVRRREVPSLEPVIIYALQYHIPPKPQGTPNAPPAVRTAWDWLATDPVLRRRTIVILDVADLRNRGQLTISEGLSWESTAQDIIYAIRKSDAYRYLLEFSQVIIRIGTAGALHIHRRAERGNHFQLYYDPLRDDGHWVRPEDGHVLGTSSLFAACVVEELVRNCNNHSEHPVLQDLPDVVGAAIPKAIRECQLRANFGLDADDETLADRRTKRRETDEVSSIASAAIPTQRLGPWSILNDVTQARLGTVAREIVRHGVVPTLVQRVPSYDDILRALANMAAVVAVKALASDGLSPKPVAFFDCARTVGDLIADALTGPGGPPTAAEEEVLFEAAVREFSDFFASAAENYLEINADGAAAACEAGRNDVLAAGLKTYRKEPAFVLLGPYLRRALEKILRVQPHTRAAIIETLVGPHAVAAKAADVWATGADPDYLDLFKFVDGRGATRATFADYKKDLTYERAEAFNDSLEAVRKHYSLDLYHRYLEDIGPDLLDPDLNAIVRAPVYRVSESVLLVDRHEIEGVRTIKKLLLHHMTRVRSNLSNKAKLRPLSFAVFGPAGSGKSTAVKAVLDSLNDGDKKPKQLEYNMSRYSTPDELSKTFDEISEACNTNENVIVFFDEFDARFGGERWGWLKYFLSPMEDGKFAGRSVPNAVFVFAGGTSTTYADFNLPESHPDFQLFRQAKGPDFTSRLKGHLDIIGVNPTDATDQLYLIRRAVIIRQLLEFLAKEQGPEDRPEANDKNEFRIDDDLLRALLFVPGYRNGARSIRNILQTCGMSRNRITNSSLTTVAQLNMFTDGQAFFDLLNNVSAER